MQNRRIIEVSVGILMLLGIAAFVMLALKVSGLTSFSNEGGYRVYADFSNIGGLKVRAPVTIAGVRVGEVSDIELDPSSFNAKVTLMINDNQNKIPLFDTSARILTEGLLGSNYVSIVPGFESEEEGGEKKYLRDGDLIIKTQEAVILENLIGQLLFNINK